MSGTGYVCHDAMSRLGAPWGTGHHSIGIPTPHRDTERTGRRCGEARYTRVMATTMGLITLSLMHVVAALEAREPMGTARDR